MSKELSHYLRKLFATVLLAPFLLITTHAVNPRSSEEETGRVWTDLSSESSAMYTDT